MEGERVIAFHPKVVSDYRMAVARLEQTMAEAESPDIGDDAIPRIRALIHSITLLPASAAAESILRWKGD
jgi:hypothetical protein